MSRQKTKKEPKEKLTKEQLGLLLFKADKVDQIDENNYWVRSQNDDDKGYRVNYDLQSCECPSYSFAGEACKHWYACKFYRNDKLKKLGIELQLAESKIKDLVIKLREERRYDKNTQV